MRGIRSLCSNSVEYHFTRKCWGYISTYISEYTVNMPQWIYDIIFLFNMQTNLSKDCHFDLSKYIVHKYNTAAFL